jgi:hypothetical protein
MCPSYGVTAAGFVVKPLAQIQTDIQNNVLASVDPNFDLSPATPDGQILGIVANGYASLWELAQVAFNSFNRDDVEGAGLDNIGDITYTPREGPSYTEVLCDLTFAAGSTLFSASTWDPITGQLSAGVLVANVAGLGQSQFANVNPVQQPSGGGVVENVRMRANVIATTPSVNPGTLTQITTPVTGWEAINNPLAQAQLGTDGELDAAYALRQSQDIGGQGSCTASATAAALNELGASQTPPVTLTVTVIENVLSTPQTVNGVVLPPHTYLPVIYDAGTGYASSAVGMAAIGAVIYANKPAGITTAGTVSGVTAVAIEDPFLGTQTVYYLIPAPQPLYITMTVVPRGGIVFSDLVLAIQQALVSAAVAPDLPDGSAPIGQLAPGADVIGSQLSAITITTPGVYDVRLLKFGLSPSPSNTAPLVIPASQVASVLPENITIAQGTFP